MIRILNILLGCMLVSSGLIMLGHAEVATGGTAGLSLTLSYLVDIPFAWLFFLINIPFYVFSVMRMGWNFTLFTLLSVSLVTAMSSVDRLLPDFAVNMYAGTLIGSLLCGLGLSTLFMNKASLGGSNILALFLQQRYKANPGTVNFIIDSCIVALGFYSAGIIQGILSIASVFIVSSVISYFKKRISVGSQRTVRTGPRVASQAGANG
ncbi:uncharacterized membrane-anchored protein YitT (DUF2179 family) [Paenibacillus phyllosphaerae]|uniref:Uncharacterized membrane-anchored protein YitT (DUF2179 family) n=1 Tax=Paenibacillus phyllosphaerae TaxID=274593 RepID=A0A7W5B107_9BACL|nr:YitT family protein [Paenibacillus phyllosphaerae]MBB3112388.1 uncharacterized membrane-anchored protein YitT (DUF2179 family) [Paenibacillus phyllosphaerae]